MSSTSAPAAAAPAAPSASAAVPSDPTVPQGAEPGGERNSPAGASTAEAKPETYSIKGKSYSVADLEAALSTHSTVDQAMKALARKEAEVKASEDVWKDKGKLRAQLKKYGVSEAELAEEILLEEISQSEMTPDQKELAALKAEKAERLKSEETQKESEKAKAQQAQIAQIQEAMQAQFVQAMGDAGIPKTPATVIRMTQVMLDALDAGFEITPSEAATLMRAETVEANRPVYEGMTTGQLREALGPKVVEAIVKDYTASLQQSTNRAPDGAAARKAAPPQKSGKPMTLDEIIAAKQAAPRRG